ncbi:MAG: DUF4091 domain-containing protein [Bacteroidales bacterium]|nr:DUF4091 domain-containing protein [Bacteroidales bacterium]
MSVFLIVVVGIGLLSSGKREGGIRLYQVDPLYKVLKEWSYFRDEMDTVRVARGETATIQLAVKGISDVDHMQAEVTEITCGKFHLSGAVCGWVGYVRTGRSYSPPSVNIIKSASGYFPDPILTDSAFCIEQGEVQPLWITVPVNENSHPGLYRGNVAISGYIGKKKHTWTKEFYIRVYPVTLGKSPLLVSNWSAHFNPVILGYLNRGEEVAAYSDLYWKLIETHAEMMASHKQNVYRIFPLWQTWFTYADGKYSFDFSRLDREIEIFMQKGGLERIEGGHLAWRSGAWDDPFFVEVPLPDDENTRKLKKSPNPVKSTGEIRSVLLPVTDLRAQNFLKQFLPALKEHLQNKGWLDRYIQHIADEPTAKNAPSYGEISRYIREYLPGVKILDAVLTSKELSENIDIWIPELDILHKDNAFYQDLKRNGKEVWFYTCVGPRGNYANRFIELPLIQTRLLHWINYKYQITGYLHWGLNFWEKDQLYIDASRDRGRLPAGDNCIVYPGYGKLYTSIRFEAMRDGIDDYQLLTMLEAKNPNAAKTLAGSVILNFNEYDNSVTFFRKVRKRLLEQLCDIDN